ncbi:MAG TPA: hypothetical protein VHI50_13095 [Micromonosporaceae bacterium]|nr:hypothetical protein [Micromonosporaceae bacterium]
MTRGPGSQRAVDAGVPVRCHYATDPDRRPACTLTAINRALRRPAAVPACAARRSTVGKGEPPRPLPPGPALDVLEWIDAAHAELLVAEHTLAAAVARARQHGHSWSTIGARLGISRQGTQQRFGATG